MELIQPFDQSSQKKPGRQSSRGQVVIEYVLLLIVVVVVATLMTRLLVRRDPNSPGIITTKWHMMVDTIGADYASEQ